MRSPPRPAAVAVEKVFSGVHQKTGLLFGVQRAQSHEPPAGNAPGGLPILRLQVVQQGNLLFECVHGRPRHGEFASNCRLRSIAAQSQARMVGVRQKACQPGRQNQKAFTLQHRLSSLRRAQRRNVAGSGNRLGSLHCGAACSQGTLPLQLDSQACCRHRRLYWPYGDDQVGRMVKVSPHGRQRPRRIQIQSWFSSWAGLRRWPWPMMVWRPQRGQQRGNRANGNACVSHDLSCGSGSAIKRIKAGVKARC